LPSAGATFLSSQAGAAAQSAAAQPAGVSPHLSGLAAQLLPQLAQPILALATAGQGVQSLRLRLTPENLGTVTVAVEITRGAVDVRLVPSTGSGHDALRQILPQLRADLGQTVADGSLTLSDPGASNADSGGRTAGNPHQGAIPAPPLEGGRRAGSTRQDASSDPVASPRRATAVLDVFA
jgi:flagellar hook-length control protein FliK